MKIAVIVPTIRPESWIQFILAWEELFKKHKVMLFKVDDSEEWPNVQMIEYKNEKAFIGVTAKASRFEWIFNKSDVCRNAGFYYASKFNPDVYISLDDDVLPNNNDPIQEHLDALSITVPSGWISTCQDIYPRGVPYGVRKEMPVVLSHGVWANVPDLDAPTQLLYPDMKDIRFNKMNIPVGVLFPFCAMNFAFKPELLPYIYQAPMSIRLTEYDVERGDRFGDIWSGIIAKRACDANNWGVVTGYSTIYHSRASNVFANLRKESVFLELNETFASEFYNPETTDKYVLLYRSMLAAWQKDLTNE